MSALAFAREGANLVLVSREEQTLDEAAAKIRKDTSVDIICHPADLASDTGREELHREFAKVDILVNNAGAVPGGSLSDLDMNEWRAGWELKFWLHSFVQIVQRIDV